MIGIIGYCVPTGLGVMTRELRQQLEITSQLTIANHDFDPPWNMEWAQDTFLNGAGDDPLDPKGYKWEVQEADFVAWVKSEKITTLITIESTFGAKTMAWARHLGVRTILIPMWEWFDQNNPAFRGIDLYLCPSFRCFQEVPFDVAKYLPWPVDTEQFPFTLRTGPAKKFIHNAGTGGMNGRKGTEEAIAGFITADVEARLVVRSQHPLVSIVGQRLLGMAKEHPWIELREGTVPDPSLLYHEGDVLIYTSKYDGHSLVGLEGMCAGMPVITTDADPMNELFPADYPLLVKVGSKLPAKLPNPRCEQNIVSIEDLADKIRWCASNDMEPISRNNRKIVEEDFSWHSLRERWKAAIEVFESQSLAQT